MYINTSVKKLSQVEHYIDKLIEEPISSVAANQKSSYVRFSWIHPTKIEITKCTCDSFVSSYWMIYIEYELKPEPFKEN